MAPIPKEHALQQNNYLHVAWPSKKDTAMWQEASLIHWRVVLNHSPSGCPQPMYSIVYYDVYVYTHIVCVYIHILCVHIYTIYVYTYIITHDYDYHDGVYHHFVITINTLTTIPVVIVIILSVTILVIIFA